MSAACCYPVNYPKILSGLLNLYRETIHILPPDIGGAVYLNWQRYPSAENILTNYGENNYVQSNKEKESDNKFRSVNHKVLWFCLSLSIQSLSGWSNPWLGKLICVDKNDQNVWTFKQSTRTCCSLPDRAFLPPLFLIHVLLQTWPSCHSINASFS